MKQFNENLKNIRKRVEEYLDYKKMIGMVKNDDGQKFWRGKLLVGAETWGEMMGRTKIDALLKHMPDKFVKHPLPPLFDFAELLAPKYNNWMFHYISYLVEICHEPSEGLYDKINKW